MKITIRIAARAVALLGLLGIAGPLPAQEAAKRDIIHITGDLYRFQNNFHYSVLLVTPEGVIATDPIDAQAATWLKSEIARRFDQPVRYLLYSHDHVDHIAGGEVFADTAVVVAHENAKTDIIDERRPTAVPDITFSDRLEIELGGKTVELIYVGPSHSDNMVVMRFPQERVLFVVDIIPIRTLAWRNLTDAYLPEWMAAIEKVEGMDFDILAPGHGPLGTKDDAVAFRGYMEALYHEVVKAVRAGRSLEEMQRDITMPAYAEWGNYPDHLPLNIEGMYKQIELHRRGN